MAKVKIPKRVAGVKVPKELRKQAKKAIDRSSRPRATWLAGLAIAAENVIDADGQRAATASGFRTCSRTAWTASSLAKCCAPPPSKAPGVSSRDSRGTARRQVSRGRTRQAGEAANRPPPPSLEERQARKCRRPQEAPSLPAPPSRKAAKAASPQNRQTCRRRKEAAPRKPSWSTSSRRCRVGPPRN